jgi:nitrogen regulatory protein PII
LKDANEMIRDANTGGMRYYRIEGRGGIKVEYASGKHCVPEFIPRIKVEVVVKDE